MRCPICKKDFPKKYVCESWSRPGIKFFGAGGFALCNFKSHIAACKKRARMLAMSEPEGGR